MDTKYKIYAWLAVVATIGLLLLLASFFMLQEAQNGLTSNTTNQIGLQRARVGRMTKDVLLIVNPSTPTTFTQSVSELQVSLPLWERAERGLQVGDTALGLPAHVPSDVLLLVVQAQPDYVAMDTAFHNILAKPDDNTVNLDIQAQIVLDHEVKYYPLVSQINGLWQQRIAAIHTHVYDILMFMLAGVTCLVIVNFVGMMRWAKKVKKKESTPV